jgi:hypothetical protein
MPMLRDKLVVTPSLRATKLHGAPRLISTPDDFEMYYLAESSIDEDSLPTQVQALVGESVTFVNAPHCQANVGKLSAWAWADQEGAGWKSGNPPWNAARAFRDGDSFLVGELLGLNCSQKHPMGATRDLPAHFHAWQVLALSDEARTDERVQLMQKGLVALKSEPALATANQRYERLRHDVAEPLPEHWWLLPRSYISWSLATDGDAALLIVELQSQPMIAKLQFSAAWLGIWCIGSGGRLQSLGLDYVPKELSDTITNYRHHLEVAGAPGEMPLILYSNYALRPEAPRGGSSTNGDYEVYHYALPPPPRLE